MRGVYILFILFFSVKTLNGQVPASERAALQALYTSLNGDNWISQTDAIPANDWDFTGTVTSNWFGVTVAGGHVTELRLYGTDPNNFIGSLPPEIGDFPQLLEFHIREEQVSGAIPTTIGNLTELRILDIVAAAMDGSIPEEIGNLTNLERINLFNNNFSGTIPTQLQSCINLTEIDLRVNQFSGEVPDFFASFPNLRILSLSMNDLTGNIPPSIGSCLELVNLGLGFNQLNGPLPASIGNCTNLTFLGLARNQLSGDFPNFFDSFPNMEALYLHNNAFTGSLPESISTLGNLRQLLIDNNELTGEIPSSYGNLASLRDLTVERNNLSGQVPASLSNLMNLEVFSINDNQLEGLLPNLSNASGLRAVRLENNFFHFGDFEDQFSFFTSTGNFEYSPQSEVNEAETLTAGCGGSNSVTLSTDVRGGANVYQWYQGIYPSNVIIPGATESTLNIDPVEADDVGDYHCRITSTIVTGLELIRRPLTVTLGDDTGTITAHPINPVQACDADADGMAEFEIDIAAIETQVLNGQVGLTIQYLDTDGNAIELTNPFTSAAQTITVQVSNAAGCSDETALELTLVTSETVDELDDVENCLTYSLPELNTGAYYTESEGMGMNLTPGTEITTTQTIYIFAGTGDCASESSFVITINPGTEEITSIPPLCTGETYELPNGEVASETGEYEIIFPDECRKEIYQITITECDCSPLFPTAFIPNGNGKNEEFNLLNDDNCAIQLKRMTIYDRWGVIVFESSTLNPSWNGGDAPQGLYLWVVEYEQDNSEITQELGGSLVLVR